ncbi:MAG: hypothetical protein WB495_20900, partial [Xanthobacteraceae bacterium]
MALPTRMKFRQLPARVLLKSERALGEAAATGDRSLASIVERWRGRDAKPRMASERPAEEIRQQTLAPAEAPQLQPQSPPQPQVQPQPAALDPNRFKLLKRPLDPAAPDPQRRWQAPPRLLPATDARIS